MQRAIPDEDRRVNAAGAVVLGGLRRKLRRAVVLDSSEWSVVLRAAAWLAVVRIGLRVFGYQRVDALASRGLSSGTRPPDLLRAARLAGLLDIAARNAIPPATCLPRALVLRRLLRREGLPAALHIGAMRSAPDGLRAHAWVTSGDAVVGDAPDVAERFPELVSGAEYLAALAEASGGRSGEGNHKGCPYT